LFLLTAATAQQYDLIIRKGRIADGAGNPWYEADLAIKDGKIAAIGQLAEAQATKVIDARRQIVAPEKCLRRAGLVALSLPYAQSL
jgi:N-acyl-D-aspartate/D-glutamate deacylase